MSPHMIAVVDGRYRVYRSSDGIAREYIGPKWATPRQAHDYAVALDSVPYVSPLRPTAKTR